MKYPIDRKERIVLGGLKQTIHIWGTKPENPVVLFLHGGPGVPNRHGMAKNHMDLTDDFTIVAWDQRGTGGSYFGCDPATLTLEQLIADMTEFVRAKVVENKIVSDDEVDATTAKIALAALKYGDLSNQPTKDYNFDLERFAAFEGNTGPYILYTIVRIKSILSRYGAWENLAIQNPANAEAKDLMLAITKFGPSLEAALKAEAPNMVCAYVYELAGCVNKFYHETPILKEENEELKAGHIALIGLAKNILETCIDILGFTAPEKM